MITDNIKFIGREAELLVLQDLLKKKTASMVVIKGRRRIGKTRLIEEFSQGKPFLRFAGLAPSEGVTAQSQRDEFAGSLARQTGLPDIKTDDWSTLFTLLAEKVKSGRQIILFDEITWMADDDATFLSKLKNAWELLYQKNPQLILILCGSISAWIEKNILSNTGYFGRISKKITLRELSLMHCNQLLSVLGFRRSSYEKFLYLSLTGGIPWYIELINSALSAADNIKSLCFDSDGILVDEHRYIFHDLFSNRSEIYEKITRLLSSKTLEYQEIADGIHYKSSGLLSDYLNELIEAGYISRSFSWEIKTGKERKISLYRLSDNYLRFYYKYIQPKLNLIHKGQYRSASITSLPSWNSIVGFQFESLVLNNRELIQKKLRLLPEEIVADDIYYQRKNKKQAGCQIDYLIQTRVNTLFVCEIKFSQHELKVPVIQEVKDKIKKLSIPRNFVCIPVLIHVNGVSEELADANYFFECINFSEFLT
ncbi:MAG: ATPase [Gammaproteobacteria bacterium RIFCSPHIGHO2_12_FULL_38_11]|nr:MAG: ATPase [Gammaproteobacteria bacterium RIFCSPHIGHO2_12_FULL_38_11]